MAVGAANREEKNVAVSPADHEGETATSSGTAVRWTYIGWIFAAAVVGFAVTAVFSGLFHLPRRWFVLAHLIVTGGFALAFLRYARIRVRGLVTHQWRRGAVWAAPFGLFAAAKVFASPVSAHATGWRLAFDLVWSGFLYATLDTMLLSVIPVLAASRALPPRGKEGTRWPMWLLAIGASALVTLTFHLGFPEYRSLDILGAMWGNTVLTLGFLVSTSALTPFAAHWVVHVAAVLHGPATTSLLPPH